MLVTDMELMIASDVFSQEVSETVNSVVKILQMVKQDFETRSQVDRILPGDRTRIDSLITVKVRSLLQNLLTHRPPDNEKRENIV